MALMTQNNRRGSAVNHKGGVKANSPAGRRRSTVSRWGNSLGFRIPQDAADQLNLKAGGQVTVEVRADSITIRPVRSRKEWTEAELLKGVTPGIVGGEIDWGPPVGREVW